MSASPLPRQSSGDPCPHCDGAGTYPPVDLDDHDYRCAHCDGTGRVLDEPACGEDGHVLCGDCFDAHSERATPTDPIVHGERWRKALEEIRDADPVDMALDPNWPARIAKAALNG